MSTIYNSKKEYMSKVRKLGEDDEDPLARSVMALEKLQMQSGGTLKDWIDIQRAASYSGFSGANLHAMEQYAQSYDRSLIYSETGCHLLQTRYLQKRQDLIEPIWVMHLRMALYMRPDNMEMWKLYFTAFSCGLFLVSSVMNDASIESLNSGRLKVGDACKLVCPSPNNDEQTVVTMIDAMKHCIMGSGVGVCGSALHLNPERGRKNIKNSLDAWAELLSNAIKIKINERRAQIAVYISVHCNTLDSFLQYKSIQRGKLNFMVGVMIPDYFITRFKAHDSWHFFDASVRFNGKCLHEYWGDEYVKAYDFLVANKLYTEETTAALVMQRLIDSIKVSGQPYIIWSDKVNQYNNNHSQGTIKTLNLCAEVTNCTVQDEFSSCVLLSCCPFYFHQFSQEIETLYAWCLKYVVKFIPYNSIDFEVNNDEFHMFLKAAFVQGCMGTLYLNNILPENDSYRQIGLSPVGLFDCAVVLGMNRARVYSDYSEVLYLGSILASLALADKRPELRVLHDNEFRRGRLQFDLRGETPRLKVWNVVRKHMTTHLMANSLLTAQAPTSTTANLLDVCESIQLPVQQKFTSQQSTRRTVKIPLGFMHAKINHQCLRYQYNVEEQLMLYKLTSKYIDHSQSTIYNIDCTVDEIKNVLVKSYNYKLKTGLYYAVFNNKNKSIKTSNECETCSL